MKYAASFLLALGLLSAASAPAEATMISISAPSGGTGVLHAPGTLANGLNVYLGAVVITGDLGTFESYCVDLQHYERGGPLQVTVDQMSNWNNTAVPVHAGLGGGAASWLYNTYAASASNTSSKAALSLAIWNSLYDDDYTVLGGTGFWVTSLSSATYGSLADDMLEALDLYAGLLPNDSWLRTQDVAGTHYTQDFIANIPEPASTLLMGAGLAALVGRRRHGSAI